MDKRALAIVVGLAAPVAGLVACGSRTGLLVPGTVLTEGDGGNPPPSEDASFDTNAADATPPPIDATPVRDAPNPFCADAADTLVYAISTSRTLVRFDPGSNTFTPIGVIDCNDPQGRSPFSMAVSRSGIAYVLYSSFDSPTPGSIYRVSLATASCQGTTFEPPTGFYSFGMAFSADDQDTGETLFVASDNSTTGQLGSINEASLALTQLPSFAPGAPAAELSGTQDGRLFAFFAPSGQGTTGMAIGQIDKTTAQVSAENLLPSIDEGEAWAFAFYGGNFYLFTGNADNETSSATRYNPTDNSLAVVATWPELIVGAGVSTCAPSR